MLTDTALRNLKPKSKIYKASDRDGMYVTVSPTGTVTFRYDYRLNGRRETLTIGRYGPAGISLALAREKLIDAKKAVAQGKSPALEKQRDKRRLTAAKTFGEITEKWLADARMADSTKAMRKHIVDRDILPVFQNRQLNEITADDLRALCSKVKERGAPATAVHVRDIVKQVYSSPFCMARTWTTPPTAWARRRLRPSSRRTARCRRWRSGWFLGRWNRLPPIRPSGWRCA